MFVELTRKWFQGGDLMPVIKGVPCRASQMKKYRMYIVRFRTRQHVVYCFVLVQFNVLLCAGSIQCLIFGKKWFNSILLTQNSIQIKINSGDSIQKIFQFNCRGTIDTGLIRKVPISVKNRQKRRFLNQELKILKKSIQKIIQYHFWGIFNSTDYSSIFFRKIKLKNWFKNLNLAVFNSTKYSFN